MKHNFVYINGGWWLLITKLEELLDYHSQSVNITTDAFSNLINSKEFGIGMYHADAAATAIGLYGSNRGLSPIIATIQFENEIVTKQIECLRQYKEVYINRVGGYFFKYDETINYTDIIQKDSLVFPNIKLKDIHIKNYQY